MAEPTPGPDRDPLADAPPDSTPDSAPDSAPGTMSGTTPDSTFDSVADPVTGPVSGAATDGEDFEETWRELQVTFVDDPAAAVRGAAELLERAVAELRASLEGSDSTEDQRTAFRRYRDVFRTLR